MRWSASRRENETLKNGVEIENGMNVKMNTGMEIGVDVEMETELNMKMEMQVEMEDHTTLSFVFSYDALRVPGTGN